MTQYINHRNAAIKLNMHEQTLKKLVLENRVPTKKEGRQILYLLSDIEKLGNTENSAPSDIKSQIIMVHSGKGGTGKTTITNYLAKILSKSNKKVLVVDADPQHYFSRFWILHVDEENRKNSEYNLLSLLNGEKKLTKCAIQINENFHFIMGNRNLEHYDSLFATAYGKELKMQHALKAALSQYDYIIIDTSPSQGGVTVPSLFACHELICPIDPEVDSLDSALQLIKTIENIKRTELANHFPLVKMYILPIKQKEGFLSGKFEKEVLKEIRESFKNESFVIDVEVLDPILDYENIPIERWQGKFNEETKAYNNFFNVFKGVFKLHG